jgi:hypothetical protein
MERILGQSARGGKDGGWGGVERSAKISVLFPAIAARFERLT